jgi:cation diffusion facilitator CzcD-associated flavoprotein CzcO
LIGTGSSGVQILPNIYDQASKIHAWVRNPIWITAGFAPAFAGKDGANFECIFPTARIQSQIIDYVADTKEQQEVLSDPESYLAYRKMIEGELNKRFGFIIKGSAAAKAARDFAENEMKTKLASRPDLIEKIMPTNFGIGCRRPTPGNGYLEALSGEKTTTYTGQLQRITEKGFIDPNGNEQEVDVIICATGFDTSYIPAYDIHVNGTDVRAKWCKDTVPSYLSASIAEMPNFFIFAGAFCPSAHGSFFPIVDAYSNYFIKFISKIQRENIRSLRPKAKAAEQFVRHAKTFLKRTAWTDPCSSWFKGGKGVDATPKIYPGSRVHFLRLLDEPRYEDFDYVYEDEGDLFGFMGNGFHVCERDGSDITWYFGRPGQGVDEERLRGEMSGLKGFPLRS